MRWMLLLCCCWPLLLSAQKKVLPVRINQKWGYINLRGKVVIPPKYDGLGEEGVPYHGPGGAQPLSRFRMVSIGDRCGLLDHYRRETFPPVYRQIFVLADTLFAVRTDSGFYLQNHRRQTLLDLSRYDDVYLPQPGNLSWTEVLLVRQQLKWGLIRRNGAQVLPPAYARLYPQRDAPEVFVFQLVTGGRKGLVDARGKVIVPAECSNLIAFSNDGFFRLDREGWSLIDRSRKKLNNQFYGSVRRLNKTLYEVSQDKGIALFSCVTKKLLTQFDVNYQYKVVDEHYLLRTQRDSVHLGAIGSNGLSVKVAGRPLTSIHPIRPGVYAASMGGSNGKRFWGVWERGCDTFRVKTIYTRIYAFKDSFAVVELDKKQGLINMAFQEVLPPVFKSVLVLNRQVKASTDTAIVLLDVLPGGQLGAARQFMATQTIRVVEIDSFVELERAPLKKTNYADLLNYDRSAPEVIRINDFAWRYNSNSETFRLYHADTLFLPMVAEQVVVLKKLHLALVFDRDNTHKNAFTARMIRDKNTPLCRMALFDYLKGDFVTGFDFLGCRYTDFEDSLSCAAVFDLDGKMGLLRTDGQQISDASGKPLRWTFIDMFFEGAARFCPEGRLEITEDTDPGAIWEMGPLNSVFEMTAPSELAASFRFRNYTIAPENAEKTPRWGVLSNQGKELLPAQYQYIQGLNDNGIMAYQKGNWGVLNFRGDTILGFRYRWVSDYGDYWKIVVRSPREFFFPSPLARAALPTAMRPDSAQIRQLAKGTYEQQELWPNGWIKVGQQKKFGVLGRQGQWIALPAYADVQYLNDGLIGLKSIQKQHWVIVDSTRKTIIQRTFDQVQPFFNGIAMAQINGRPCFVDKIGNIDLLHPADRVKGWSDGYAVVDTSLRNPLRQPLLGCILINPNQVNEFGSAYVDIKTFKQGLAQVRKGYFWGTLNRHGLYLTPPKYVLFDIKPDGVAVKVPTLIGLADKTGKIIVPPQYDRIELVDNRYFRVEQGSAVGYLNLDGTWLYQMNQ
jgi:hypothetical protein